MSVLFSTYPFPAAETTKQEQGAYSEDFLCFDSVTSDSALLPSPSFSPSLSLSSDDTLSEIMSPSGSFELITPLQQKLSDENVDIRLDDLLDWNGEQTSA